MSLKAAILLATLCYSGLAYGGEDYHREIDKIAGDLGSKIISWHRDIHVHPELGNRGFRAFLPLWLSSLQSWALIQYKQPLRIRESLEF